MIVATSLIGQLFVQALIELSCGRLNACAGRPSFSSFYHTGIVYQMAVKSETEKQHYALYQIIYKFLGDFIYFSFSVLV